MVQSIQSNLKQTYNRQCWLFRLNIWENIINLIMLVYEQRSVINNAIATMYLYFRFFLNQIPTGFYSFWIYLCKKHNASQYIRYFIFLDK